jgi:hypothetical protein
LPPACHYTSLGSALKQRPGWNYGGAPKRAYPLRHSSIGVRKLNLPRISTRRKHLLLSRSTIGAEAAHNRGVRYCLLRRPVIVALVTPPHPFLALPLTATTCGGAHSRPSAITAACRMHRSQRILSFHTHANSANRFDINKYIGACMGRHRVKPQWKYAIRLAVATFLGAASTCASAVETFHSFQVGEEATAKNLAPACKSEPLLWEIMRYFQQKDDVSATAMFRAKDCYVLPAQIRLKIISNHAGVLEVLLPGLQRPPGLFTHSAFVDLYVPRR